MEGKDLRQARRHEDSKVLRRKEGWKERRGNERGRKEARIPRKERRISRKDGWMDI
jgi:hypothetical protein